MSADFVPLAPKLNWHLQTFKVATEETDLMVLHAPKCA